MSTFAPAIAVTLKNEGGYTNDPVDPGGETNFGITRKFLLSVGESALAIDMHTMTVDQAKHIYEKYWWIQYGYGTIVDQTIATKVFDFSVNMGSSRAHKLLQQGMNNAFNSNLVVDGGLGPTTFGKVNAVVSTDDKQALLNAISDAAWSYYQSLIAQNSALAKFQNGWKNRAYAISKVDSIS